MHIIQFACHGAAIDKSGVLIQFCKQSSIDSPSLRKGVDKSTIKFMLEHSEFL